MCITDVSLPSEIKYKIRMPANGYIQRYDDQFASHWKTNWIYDPKPFDGGPRDHISGDYGGDPGIEFL